MKMNLMWACLVLGFSSGVMAMPCDTGYVCTSKSKAFSIEIKTCRNINSVHLLGVQLNGKEVKEASLGPAYDASFDGGPLNFEVKLPLSKEEEKNGSNRILTVEVSGRKLIGTVKEKFVEEQPGTFKLIQKEAIKCVSQI